MGSYLHPRNGGEAFDPIRPGLTMSFPFRADRAPLKAWETSLDGKGVKRGPITRPRLRFVPL